MTDPELIARYRPIREARKPRECLGARPCWVEDGTVAIKINSSQCAGCNGQLDPDRLGAPTHAELAAAGII